MSLQHCAITGELLQDPVVSKKSGHVFERRVIEKHIQATGQCPLTDQPLDNSDLLPIKTEKVINPRPINSTSIPNMINLLQSEWDSVMLETYNLKAHLETVRQELSHALYQHDAACRVIARVVRERDEARKELSELYEKLGVNPQQQQSIEQEFEGLSNEFQQSIEQLALDLNKKRKQNKKNPQYLEQFQTADVITQFTPVQTTALHSTTKPGIVCTAIHPENQNLIATGGVDGSIIVFDKSAEKIVNQIQAHKDKVNDICFVNIDSNIRIFSAGQDGQLLGFEFNLEGQQTQEVKQVFSHKFSGKNAAATSVAALPIQNLVAASCSDGQFVYIDTVKNQVSCTVNEFKGVLGITKLRVHPDGHLMALATNQGSVIIWGIVQNSQIAELKEEDQSKEIVTSISFSQNGYILGAASKAEGVIRIWDLRHSKLVKKIESAMKPEGVMFDYSSALLAVVGETQIQLFNSKTYDIVSTTKAHSSNITGIDFGNKSQYYITVSMDRHLYIHSQQ